MYEMTELWNFTIKDTMNINFDNPWDDNKKQQKDVENLIKDSKDAFFKMFNKQSGGNNKDKEPYGKIASAGSKLLLTCLFIVFGVWMLGGLYTVQPDEEAIIVRFGKYNRKASPGLNYKLPSPIEEVYKISVTTINNEEIGFRSASPGNADNKAKNTSVIKESYMLTVDENIIEIDFVVQWKVSDAYKFLFNVNDLRGENTVKTVAESAMREAIGLSKVTDALAEDRYQIEQKAKKILQDTLNNYGMGVEIVRVQMLSAQPPAEVIDAYRAVQSAKADQVNAINRAYSYSNDVIPRAIGEASKIRQEAEGYREAVVAEAKGQADKFNSICAQYKDFQAITRKRMYWDAMASIMKNTNKIILDSKASSVPILGLNELFNKKGSADSATQDGVNTSVAQAQPQYEKRVENKD